MDVFDGVWQSRVDQVLRNVDGDTFDCRAALPFHAQLLITVRVMGVDAWDAEDGKDRKLAAAKFTASWLGQGRLALVSFRPRGLSPVPSGGFGRWLCDVRREDGAVLADDLMAGGYARAWDRARWMRETGPEARAYWDRTRARAGGAFPD